MKVVLTIHHFPPNYAAGAELYALQLARWLVKHGHRVSVVCVESTEHSSARGIEVRHDNYLGVPVHRLFYNRNEADHPFLWSYDNPVIGSWFKDFLEETPPDIVHINSCYLLSMSTMAAAKEARLPTIVTLHDFWFVCPRIILLKPNGNVCLPPKDPSVCVWCMATEKRRFRWLDRASAGVAGMLARRLLMSPTVTRWLKVSPDTADIEGRRQMAVNALKDADLVLAPSRFLRDIFVRQGLDPAKVKHSPLGLDTSHWQLGAATRAQTASGLHLAYIGQLSPHKGIHILLEAFSRLSLDGKRARLSIYGSPKAFPEYVRLLRRLAGRNPLIHFAGYFENKRVAQVLQDIDALVTPSVWYENSPVSVMEALTSGTPVVASNLGSMPELVQHQVNGLLFKAGSANDLARQLQRLLDEPGLIDRLASQAKPVRTVDDEVSQVVEFYRQVASSRRMKDGRAR